MHKKFPVLAAGIAFALMSMASRAENLLDVYQDAVKSDPVIREADARRLAALEAKPQARGLFRLAERLAAAPLRCNGEPIGWSAL